jgi:predicted MFS family arabinose efflux permease
MALIGISIGAAFSLAFVAGPLINAAVGLRGLFVAAGALGLLAIPVLVYAVPRAPIAGPARAAAAPWRVLVAPELRILYLGVLALHLVLAASFVAIPIGLREGLHIPPARHAAVYLPVLLVSLLLIAPLIMASARPRVLQRAFYGAILALGLAEGALWLGWSHRYATGAALVMFFAAFNYLEASLPGLISRVAPVAHKGAALGAYATCQFLGMFAGGLLGGAIADRAGFAAVPLACAVLCAVWFGLALVSPAGALTAGARPDGPPALR